ncbi:Gpr1 family protein [Mycena olivaceomarginata]|nr:Gpr1 family protein [Mycena olivaceomarginata]
MSDIEKGEIYDNGSRFATAPRPSTIGNPASLGLFSFASTTFILSFYNVTVDGIAHPNVVVGMALFCGGLAQLLAGMWEFPRGNVFGGTAFTSYGAFWLSFGTIFLPGTASSPLTKMRKNLSTLWASTSFSWFIVTFMFFITFLLLGAGKFTTNATVSKAGGAFGIITAFVAYYIGLADLLAAEKAAVVGLPLGAFKHD